MSCVQLRKLIVVMRVFVALACFQLIISSKFYADMYLVSLCIHMPSFFFSEIFILFQFSIPVRVMYVTFFN